MFRLVFFSSPFPAGSFIYTIEVPGLSMSLVNGHRRPHDLNGASLSPDDHQPSPLTSPLLNDAITLRTDDEEENRRKVSEQSPFPEVTFMAFGGSHNKNSIILKDKPK